MRKGKEAQQGPEVPGSSPSPGLPKASVPRTVPRPEQGHQCLEGSVGGAPQARGGQGLEWGLHRASPLAVALGSRSHRGRRDCEYWDRHGAAMGMVKAEMETGPHIPSGCWHRYLQWATRG